MPRITLPCLLLLTALAGCGERVERASAPSPEKRPVSRPVVAYRFVVPPVVQLDPSQQNAWLRTTVRLNRALPQGGHGIGGYIEISGGHADIPGLERSPGVLRCYEQEHFPDERRPPREGRLVTVTLTVRAKPRQVLTARVPLEHYTVPAGGRNTKTLQRLGCRPAPRERHCAGAIETGGLPVGGLRAGGGATCATAHEVMAAVSEWIDSRRCFDDLCVSEHRMNAGFRCTVAKVGEADWTITCRRGRQVVRGFTAE